MFVQCIMPDESDRIRQTVIKTMMNFLLIFSVFHRETTLEELKKCHPKMAVVFNHVSKNQNFELNFERIDQYKALVLEDATDFYCNEISDDTVIGDQTWKNLKQEFMESVDYEQEACFKELTSHDKKLVESLVFAQNIL